MKQHTKMLTCLIISLGLVILAFVARIPEIAAFFTIISILLTGVVSYEVRTSKQGNQ